MAQSTMSRPGGSEKLKVEQHKKGSVESIFTLAKWQLGQTWRLLLVAEMGILAAVVLICLVPLYSSVALSAALRDGLSSSPESAYITETGFSNEYSRQELQQFQQTIDQQIDKILQRYVQQQPIFSASMPPLTIAQSPLSRTDLDFTGFAEQQIPQHVRLVEGQLPKTSGNVLKFGICPAFGDQIIRDRIEKNRSSTFSLPGVFLCPNVYQSFLCLTFWP